MPCPSLLLRITLFSLLGNSARANCEVPLLTASDGASFDHFGKSVAISGNFLVVGAPGQSGYGNDVAGSAYVLRTTDDGASWFQTDKLTASDGAADNNFGYSVAISGNLIVVGASGEQWNDDDSGSAYVFRTTDDGATWSQTTKLTASDGAAGDYFGISAAISGDLIVVGAAKDDDDRGSAYVFRTTDDGATWSQPTKLLASDGAADDYFGDSVAISGNLVVVGAKNNNNYKGSAYVFHRTDDGATWSQPTKLTASDGAQGDYFGTSVAISGNLLVVGANDRARYQDDGAPGFGSAYVFHTMNGGASWSQKAKLTASDGAAEDHFGKSVAISGNVVVVGADGNDDAGSDSGSAYVFHMTDDGASWSQTPKLLASDGAKFDQFGSSAAISGNFLVVGADWNKDAGTASGSAYAFRMTDGGDSWSKTAKLLPSVWTSVTYTDPEGCESDDLCAAALARERLVEEDLSQCERDLSQCFLEEDTGEQDRRRQGGSVVIIVPVVIGAVFLAAGAYAVARKRKTAVAQRRLSHRAASMPSVVAE